MRDAFIADHQLSWPVAVLCEVLGGGRRGFYDSLTRQAEPALTPEQGALLARSKALAEKTHPRYGSRRMTNQLQDEGYDVGRFQVRRWMKQAGVSVAGRRRRAPKTTNSRHGYGGAPHVLARHVAVTAPHVAWCGDMTSRWTEEGWWYGSVLVELYARKVGGWGMSEHVDTPWVTDA